jgi:hypothetical protein
VRVNRIYRVEEGRGVVGQLPQRAASEGSR